jgi:hypothetical protein
VSALFGHDGFVKRWQNRPSDASGGFPSDEPADVLKASWWSPERDREAEEWATAEGLSQRLLGFQHLDCPVAFSLGSRVREGTNVDRV